MLQKFRFKEYLELLSKNLMLVFQEKKYVLRNLIFCTYAPKASIGNFLIDSKFCVANKGCHTQLFTAR